MIVKYTNINNIKKLSQIDPESIPIIIAESVVRKSKIKVKIVEIPPIIKLYR